MTLHLSGTVYWLNAGICNVFDVFLVGFQHCLVFSRIQTGQQDVFMKQIIKATVLTVN